jgi:hypothetical protein
MDLREGLRRLSILIRILGVTASVAMLAISASDPPRALSWDDFSDAVESEPQHGPWEKYQAEKIPPLPSGFVLDAPAGQGADMSSKSATEAKPLGSINWQELVWSILFGTLPAIAGFALAWLLDGFAGNHRRKSAA